MSQVAGCAGVEFALSGTMGVLVWGPQGMAREDIFKTAMDARCPGNKQSITGIKAVLNVYDSSICYWDSNCGCWVC